MFDFGDYCYIEQKRYGVPNEMYQHKVIGRLRSNGWVDVPVQSPATETLHDQIVDVIACICCGVDEREVRKFRLEDCRAGLETGESLFRIPGTNTGHGHVWPRPDGLIARCGGPGICKQCALDQAECDRAKAL